MKGKRLWQTLRLYTISEPVKRTEYLRKNHVFASLGKNCSIEDRIVPLYAKCIRIGDNVRLASRVTLVTHDVSCFVMNNMGIKTDSGENLRERIGCIEIGSNVFVGTNTTILYDVKIGNNVIIGAGSLVNRDIPENSVVAGVPARVICTFDDFIEKRKNDNAYPREIAVNNQQIPEELINWCWKQFEEKHDG